MLPVSMSTRSLALRAGCSDPTGCGTLRNQRTAAMWAQHPTTLAPALQVQYHPFMGLVDALFGDHAVFKVGRHMTHNAWTGS